MKFFNVFFLVLLSFNRIANAEGFGSILIGMERKLSGQISDEREKERELAHIFPSKKDNVRINEKKTPKIFDDKAEKANGIGGVSMSTPSNMINWRGGGMVYKDSLQKKCNLKSCEIIINDWHVDRGDTLRSLLYKWSTMTGWDLVWDSKYDYKIDSSADIHDTFISAVKILFKSIGAVNPPIFIDMYEENKVIRVKNSVNK